MNTRLSRLLIAVIQLLVTVVVCVLLVPGQWYSDTARIRLAQWLGTPGYRQAQPGDTAAGEESDQLSQVELCPQDPAGWRQVQSIEGITIDESLTCLADNPHAVAAFVRGTNNVSRETLLAAGLTPDAVEKGADLDGDGDPDEIHIRLEVVELNGASPDSNLPVTSFEIAPGVTPGLWVFAPKSFGMATINFESNQAGIYCGPHLPLFVLNRVTAF